MPRRENDDLMSPSEPTEGRLRLELRKLTNPPLQEVPEDEWQCEVCVAHKLNGVSNCEQESETSGQYLRHEPIGVDRHGRKYWFIIRRLIVEGQNELHYYSTIEQFNYLCSKLDAEKYEAVLCEALHDISGEFKYQAKITDQLTNDVKWNGAKTCLEIVRENIKELIDEENRKEEQKVKEEEEKRKEEEKKREEERKTEEKEKEEQMDMENAEEK
uniref:WHIM2 domain-containing protein n=1 Tax=Ciona savignyi TaxID=51511 RepID=H2ZQ15_CIOSA